MGYKAIPDSLIAVGKATSQLLWKFARNNFDSHQARIVSLEAGSVAVPTGFILDFAGTVAPAGFLFCDGSAKNQSDYPSLFAIIGTTYGNPGSGKFNLPDLRGRSLVGSGAGSGLTSRALADVGGAAGVALSSAQLPSHTHGVTDGGHRHGQVHELGGGSQKYTFATINGPNHTATHTTNSATTGITVANAGGGASHNNYQPSTVMNAIIKT
jgi:microcystin-dependent protein